MSSAHAYQRWQVARTELDQVTRETDWRRSDWAPSFILQPLLDAVTRAEDECRLLGVPKAFPKRP